MEELAREPCPNRIITDFGGAFAMGAVGGSVFHLVKGYFNSPKGQRFQSAVNAMKVRAPIIGGSFANWGGVFSCYDCSLVAIRNKNDAMNSIASGGLTGFTLAIRSGLGGAIRSGIAGCVILAMIEGVQIAISRMIASKSRIVKTLVDRKVGYFPLITAVHMLRLMFVRFWLADFVLRCAFLFLYSVLQQRAQLAAPLDAPVPLFDKNTTATHAADLEASKGELIEDSSNNLKFL